MSNNILITGSSGFIGRYLIKCLPESRCVIRKPPVMSDRHFYVDSITSKTNWSSAFENIDIVIHLAGIAHRTNISDNKYFEINNLGTIKLAEEASKAGVKRFIFVSSTVVMGTKPTSKILTEDSPVRPENAYAYSKSEAEIALKKIGEETGMEIVIIRPSLVYALDAPGNIRLLVKMINRFGVLPFGLINNQRDLISIYNLIDFIKICCYHPKASNQTFNITDAKPISTKELVIALSKALGKNRVQVPIPKVCFTILGKLLKKEHQVNQLIGDLRISCDKAKSLLGWKPMYDLDNTFKEYKHD